MAERDGERDRATVQPDEREREALRHRGGGDVGTAADGQGQAPRRTGMPTEQFREGIAVAVLRAKDQLGVECVGVVWSRGWHEPPLSGLWRLHSARCVGLPANLTLDSRTACAGPP